MARKTTTTNGWQPRFAFDLSTGSAAAFRTIVEAFNDWRKQEPRPDLKLADGWHEFKPEICEQALLLNAGNRQVSFATVKYYAKQMLAGEWQETGQPVLFDVEGNMVDAQHREWAGYLSGATWTSFVVNQRKPIKNVFAYIDNSKARSIKDALYTAGYNGMSGVLSQVVKMAWQDEMEAFTSGQGMHEVEKLTPTAAIRYVEARPHLLEGSRLMAGDHRGAANIVTYPDVAAYVACLILENYDSYTLDEFAEQLAVDLSDEEGPLASFQSIVAHNKVAKDPMKKHQVLGYLLKAFNAWVEQDPVKRLSLKVNEPFPKIVRKQEQQEAAE